MSIGFCSYVGVCGHPSPGVGEVTVRRVFRPLLWLVAFAIILQSFQVPPIAVAAALPADPDAVAPAAAPAAVTPTEAVQAVNAAGPTVLANNYALTTDQTWGPAGSPYVVSGSLFIKDGVSLTLLPGTVVKMNGPSSSIVVWGQLLSLGTPTERVTITSLKDDSVGGDQNADADATLPAAGDWGGINFTRNLTSSPRLASVVDYTDVRFGNYGTAIACQGAMISIGGSVSVTISNSRLTDARTAGLQIANTGNPASVGVYSTQFARAKCGLISNSGIATIVGNQFDKTLSFATHIYAPKKIRFWFNTLRSQPIVIGDSPTRAEADVRYNSFLAGINHSPIAREDLQDWSANWFGSDTSLPLPNCASLDAAKAWIPAIDYVSGSGCAAGEVHPTGYRSDGVRSLTVAPLPIPASVLDALSPRVGPVDTRTGVLSWEVADLAVQDAGKELSARRTYRSDQVNQAPGHGWSGSYEEKLSEDTSGNRILSLSGGSTLPFRTDSQAGYAPAKALALPLVLMLPAPTFPPLIGPRTTFRQQGTWTRSPSKMKHTR